MRTRTLVMITVSVLVSGMIAFAQSQSPAPISITFSTQEAQATNVASKPIVMVAVTVSSKESPDSITVHEFYFVAGGMVAGDVKEVVHADSSRTITAVKPLFVQFGDGSFWGDTSSLNDPDSAAAYGMAQRKAAMPMFQGALAASQLGDQALIDYLSAVTTREIKGFAAQFLGIQKSSGTTAAVAQIQRRLSAAKSWGF